MVRGQIGNEIGVTARDKSDEGLLGTVVTDGANSFTVSAADFRNFRVGMVIDVVTKTTGVVGAGVSARTITAMDSATNTITYSGADATLTTAMGAYMAGSWELASPATVMVGGREDYINFNGGPSVGQGFDMAIFGSVQGMRERLKAINATTYSDTELDKMTMNDLVYALRVNDAPGSI